MGSRDLDLIIRILKSRESDANLKKIKADVDKIQKQLSTKIDYGKQMAKGMTQASVATEKLRKNVDALTKSFKALGREAGKEVKKINFQKTTNEIEKLVANVRRTNKEVGGFARSSISSFRKVTDSVGPATNAMSDMANMQSSIEKHTTTLDGLTSNLRTKYHALIPSLGQVANLFGSVSANMGLAAAQTAKTYEALTLLTKKIREIQIVGRLRGVLNLNQDIKSLKLFRAEIEKLRIDLATIRGEKVAGREFGVTSKMVEDLRRARVEVDLLRERYVKLGQNVKELEKLNIKFKEQAGLINKNVRVLGSYIRNADKIKELPGKIQNTVVAYAKVREEIIRIITQMGRLNSLQGQTGAIYPEHFRRSWEILRKEFKEGSSEIEVLLRKIEVLHKKTTQQIVDNNLKIAQSSLASINAQRDDFADLETLTSRQRTSIDQLVQKYRELKVGLDYLGTGFRTSAGAQKLATEVLKESNTLLSTLAPKYRRLAQEINAWTVAQMKGISTGRTFSIMLKDLSGAIRRLAAEEEVLVNASRTLGNEQNLLEKRLSLARRKAKLFSDAIIQLHEALLKLNPVVAKDAIQIKKINLEIGKLAKKSIDAAKSVKHLSSELTRVSLKGGDAVRAMYRVSAEGFGSMIVSQAAWMAGFQVVFGTLDKFKAALMSVVQLQEAVVRAMRTARSETMSSVEVYQAFTDAIVKARMRTGAAIEDLGEIMYQLGSAGLSAEESMAALDSTLANIIGTEAEVRNITKLIAGLYNNFADSIVKVDGSMTSLSATSKEWKESLVKSASLTEKFTYINDLLVAAFRDNQVEMMEMRDGLKFMVQSGKAANLALDEMVGILSFLNNHMIKSGQAGRAMRVILSKLTKDAAGFAEAFDIDINLQKPLDFLKIMRDINKRYDGQAISVEELGKVFKKLGLRGAEAFNLIMRNVGILESTIGNLQDTLEGAAAEMERIRLSDLASQAGIAAAKIEGLLRTGMIPLAKILGVLVGGFNLIASTIMSLNKSFDGALGHILKFVATMALVGGGAILIKNLIHIFSWFGTVLLTVTNLVLSFGGAQEVAAGATLNLGAKIFALGNMAKLAAGAGIFYLVQGLILVAKRFGEASIRASEYAKKQKKIYEEQVAYTNSLDLFLPLLEKQEKITDKNRNAIQRIIVQTGIKITKQDSDAESIKKVYEATVQLIKAQKESLAIQKEIALGAELESMKEQMKEIAKYGEAGLTIWQKLRRDLETGEAFEGFIFPKGFFEQFGNLDKAISASNEKITSFNKLIETMTKNAEKYKGTKLEEEYHEQLNAITELRNVEEQRKFGLEKLYREQQKASEAAKNYKKDIEGIRKTTDDLRLAEDGALKIKERLISHSKKYSSELSSLRKAIGSMKVMSTVFKELGSSGTVPIENLLEKLKELGREESVKRFSKEVEILSDRMKSMPDEESEIKKLIKDAAKLGTDGSKAIHDFGKEISILKNKQLELTKISSQLEMNYLAIEISGLGISAKEAERAISGLMSATGKLQNRVDLSKNSIMQANFELNKLKSIYRIAASGTDEYKKAQEGILTQRRILSVLNERLTRHEIKMLNEVGSGIRTFKEMQERTEKFVIAEEDAIIEVIKMKSALRLVKSGSEEYAQALENLSNAQKVLMATEDKRIQIEYEEILNTIKLRDAYSGIESSIRGQINLLSSWQKEYKGQQEAYENEISQLGNSAEALRDKNNLYQDIEASIKSQIQKLDEQYGKEEELIKIAEKTGRMTASEAAVKRLEMMAWHESERLKLQKDLLAASQNHQEILEKIRKEYDAAMEKLRKGVENIEGAFTKLQILLAKIAITIGDKIVGDKELILNVDREQLDAVEDTISELVGTPYTITMVGKYIPPPNLSKPINDYHGGLTLANGGMVPARVTNGEGYIPPSTAMGHLDALNTLNGGRATGSIPSSIAKFHGPGGIDNIPALLPKGSYVLSTKGMAAYERSIAQGATGFQEGGEVNEEIMSSGEESKSEIGRFTIVVQKEGVAKEYPIYGRPSVLRELQEELETERLTKLH